ncbi:hypothetical protein VE23_03005 [Paenibacillus sp. D9]|uniref:hypothetical protein n=1 Tax=Paenibacillus sp. D9 TaxID=665792 RepID=UPI00061FD499|nr:hypothetical protein [Paenibacillus sp. D9]KKC46316.1 hypothetical protein VE23_03005 [Paenibacillus sp. D9]
MSMRIREFDGNSDRKIGCTRSGALQANSTRSGALQADSARSGALQADSARSGALQADCKRSGSISCLPSEHSAVARAACQPDLEKRQRSPFPEDSFP